MNQKIKLGLYAALILGAAVFGALFYSSYKSANKSPDPTDYSPTNLTSAGTNGAGQSTNITAQTNLADTTNQASSPAQTNTNSLATNAASEPIKTPTAVSTAAQPVQGRSSMIGYFAAFLAMAIFLGLLIARDISEYFGNRSVEFMFNDEGTGIKDPDYEVAEQEWANGNHLEAIRLMREYLQKNPRSQGVALRIAEIYEKDLRNNLAAALEYEEVLKCKLPPERWGWGAIHLCNLYSKMEKTDQAVALLHRIVNEYGQTAAAKKARERLGMFEPVVEESPGAGLPDSVSSETPTNPADAEEKPSPASNLPPGFRPKK